MLMKSKLPYSLKLKTNQNFSFNDFTITSEDIRMRPILESDAEFVFGCLSNPSVIGDMDAVKLHNVEHTRKFLMHNISRSESAIEMNMIVEDSLGEPIGACYISGAINNDYPEIGVWLDAAHHGKGIGAAVCTVLISFIDSFLDCKGIVGCAKNTNEPMTNIFSKLNFWLVSSQMKAELFGNGYINCGNLFILKGSGLNSVRIVNRGISTSFHCIDVGCGNFISRKITSRAA